MRYLTIFDISDNKRRRVVTKLLKKNGARMHRSVFLCDLDASVFGAVVDAVSRMIDDEKDSVRFYPQCSWDENEIKKIGDFQFESICDSDDNGLIFI